MFQLDPQTINVIVNILIPALPVLIAAQYAARKARRN